MERSRIGSLRRSSRRSTLWPCTGLVSIAVVFSSAISSSGFNDDPGDLLQPTFEWNAGLPPSARYITPVAGSTSRNIAVQGAVAIRKWENPKQLVAVRQGTAHWRWNADPLDVLTLQPLDEERALATITVHLRESDVGLNRFRLMARTDGQYAAALAPSCPLVRAVLAPLNSPGRVLREVDLDLSTTTTRMGGPFGNVSLTEVSHRTYPGKDDLGEWMEIRGQFWVLEKELGNEVSVLGSTKLFVTLGCEQVQEGVAAFVDMRMTNSGLMNVGLGAEVHTGDSYRGVMQEHDHADHYHLVNKLVPSSLLTDGVQTGLAYAVYDQNPTQSAVVFPLAPMPERGGVYTCGVRLSFAYAAHVTRWKVQVSDSPRLSGANWRDVIQMEKPGWPRSHWNFDAAKAYLSAAVGINDTVHSAEEHAWLASLEESGGVGSEQRWEDEMWARQELSDNPISHNIHEFNCTHATYVRLRLEQTVSHLFAVSEVEVFGYPMSGGNDSASTCPLRCRHGGECLLPSSSLHAASCSCPSAEWGWSGPLCRICNRTTTQSHYELFNVDVEAPVRPTIFEAWRLQTIINGGSSVRVNQLQRAYDELADPTSRQAYDAARAAPCSDGEDLTPCMEDCPIVLAEKTSGSALVGRLQVTLAPWWMLVVLVMIL